jgi:hypothetical protein
MVEGTGAGFFRVEGGSIQIPAKLTLKPAGNDEQLFEPIRFTEPLTLTFVSVDPRLSEMLRRELRRYWARLHAMNPANARIILRHHGKTIFDGKIILKSRKARVAKIAGRNLNHGTH